MSRFVRVIGFLTLCVALAYSAGTPAHALSVSWSGQPIDPLGDPGVDQTFFPSGTAMFDINGGMLTIMLTNTTTAQVISQNWQANTGLTWDITDSGVVLDPVTAMIKPGSFLVGPSCQSNGGSIDCSVTDLSLEWGFTDTLNAGSVGGEPVGSYAISAVGDTNGIEQDYVQFDVQSPPGSLFGAPKLGKTDGGIVGPDPSDFIPNMGFMDPVVQNAMQFKFNISGDLSMDEITNVRPFFGTDGGFLVSEPSTLLLLGPGLAGLAAWRFRRTRRPIAS